VRRGADSGEWECAADVWWLVSVLLDHKAAVQVLQEELVLR
jgi:hypothetical protein